MDSSERTLLTARPPLNVLFLITRMEVGGAEMLLANMVRQFDRDRINPQIGCLKSKGELGRQLASEIKIHSGLIHSKYDARVIGRIRRILHKENIDALVTVGAGDKMFWGRLAARQAKLPVVISALHSTGWPDGVGRLNRLLTPLTDAFVAVAEPHRQYLVRKEKFPAEKVHLIPNGIDTDHFVFDASARHRWRRDRSIGNGQPVCGIVAALRPEKNHQRFLRIAETVGEEINDAHFLVVGDGPERHRLEAICRQMPMADRIHLVGSSHDIVGALSAMDLFVLTSDNEANPVSILEAMSVGLPVVATRVGSIHQSVIDGLTGFLADSADESQQAQLWSKVLEDPTLRNRLGAAARQHVVKYGSLKVMTDGYCHLIEEIYDRKGPSPADKAGRNGRGNPTATHSQKSAPHPK